MNLILTERGRKEGFLAIRKLEQGFELDTAELGTVYLLSYELKTYVEKEMGMMQK